MGDGGNEETMGDHYSDLMQRLEEAQDEEDQKGIMQQIVPILGNSQYAESKVARHVMVSWKRLAKNDLLMPRLLLKRRDVEYKILPRLKEDEDIKKGIPVIVYSKDGKPYDMHLTLRDRFYFLRGGCWREFVHEQGFQIGDYIIIWLFCQRHAITKHLRLAIAPRQLPNDETSEE